MKKIISISADEGTLVKICEILDRGTFRNKSHVVEEAVKKLWREKDGD